MSYFTRLWYLWPKTSLTSQAVPDVLPWFVYCGWSAHKATTFSWFLSSYPCRHCMFNRNVPWTFNRTPVLARPHHLWEFTWPVRACLSPCFMQCVPDSLALVCPVITAFSAQLACWKGEVREITLIGCLAKRIARRNEERKGTLLQPDTVLTLHQLHVQLLIRHILD